MIEIGAARFLFFCEISIVMEREELMKVASGAAQERGCVVCDLAFDDDDNVFELTIDKTGADVELDDCEYVHRAILAAFDRNVEDYALTVSSPGISGSEADELLNTIE